MYGPTRFLSRQELYHLVWSDPMAVVAERLGMSDVGLAKACRWAFVRVPERGYWAKRQAGSRLANRACQRVASACPIPPTYR